MIRKNKEEEKSGEFLIRETTENLNQLNKVMEKLRARLFTLAEASLPDVQASSFKKAIKDYTSESWNELTKLICILEDNIKE